MRRIVACVALTLITALPAAAAEMTGYLSDDACVSKNLSAKKAMDWIQPTAFEACVKKCVKEGSAVVFVTEDNKVLRLDAASLQKAMPHIGKRVSVKASVSGSSISLDSVVPIAMGAHTGTNKSADEHDHSR